MNPLVIGPDEGQECEWMEWRLVRGMTGCVGITSGSSHKLGKYPSELNWSSLGIVLGFIYITVKRTDHAMLQVATNGK